MYFFIKKFILIPFWFVWNFFFRKIISKFNPINRSKNKKLINSMLRAYNYLLVLLIVTFASCSSSKKEENRGEVKLTDTKDQAVKIVHEIPSPSEIPFLLEATGISFDPSLVNDFVKADNYSRTSTKAAYNLGVYATDIGYFASYQKVQNVLNYLEAARKLAEKLGALNAFDLKTLKRFESNLASKDSLAAIVNESINKTELYLEDTQRNKISAFVIAGSFIEGLYISTALVKHYPREILPEDSRNLVLTPLIRVIVDQEKPLKDLILLLEAVEADDDVSIMLELLYELRDEYQKLGLNEKIHDNRSDLVLSDGLLDQIIDKTGKIRDFITH
jgi:hypothetical protein